MTFTHALSTNNYGPAKFIVDASAANGTHTTIASALTSASSGDTIFIRPGTYTEDLSLKAGVNICAYTGDSSLNVNSTSGFHVTIVGKATATFSGEVSISNVCLKTNSDFVLVVSGSANTVINLNNCFLYATSANALISMTSTGSPIMYLNNCFGNLGIAGSSYFSFTSASGTATLKCFSCVFANSTPSTTASSFTNSTVCEMYNTTFNSVITGANSANITIANCPNLGISDTTAITLSNTSQFNAKNSFISSGTATAVTIGAGCTGNIFATTINSSNTNVISGSGTLNYGMLEFSGSSSGHNVTTENILPGSNFQKIVVQTFTSTGTYTPTAGMKYCQVEVVGAA